MTVPLKVYIYLYTTYSPCHFGWLYATYHLFEGTRFHSIENMWVFPKIGGFPPKSSIFIGFSTIFTIHFGGFPLFLETPMSEPPFHHSMESNHPPGTFAAELEHERMSDFCSALRCLDVPGRNLGSKVRISGWFHPKEYPIYYSRWNKPLILTIYILTSVPGHPSTNNQWNTVFFHQQKLRLSPDAQNVYLPTLITPQNYPVL